MPLKSAPKPSPIYAKSEVTKPVSARLTAAELASVSGKARTAGLNLSEWVRRTLLADVTPVPVAGPPAVEALLLEEICKLQAIVLNVAQAAGLSATVVKAAVADAESKKAARARKLLAGEQARGS